MNKKSDGEIHEINSARGKIGWQNEADPTMEYLNPFTATRNKALLRQTEVAQNLGVDIVEVIRLEQAIFTHVPSAYVNYFVKTLGMPEKWEAGYRAFQRMLRQTGPRPIHGVWQYPKGELTFRRWRLHNWPTMSQMGWCKAFCIHPAALYAIEKSAKVVVPPDILKALIEANIFSEDQARGFARRIHQANLRASNQVEGRAA